MDDDEDIVDSIYDDFTLQTVTDLKEDLVMA